MWAVQYYENSNVVLFDTEEQALDYFVLHAPLDIDASGDYADPSEYVYQVAQENTTVNNNVLWGGPEGLGEDV